MVLELLRVPYPGAVILLRVFEKADYLITIDPYGSSQRYFIQIARHILAAQSPSLNEWIVCLDRLQLGTVLRHGERYVLD